MGQESGVSASRRLGLDGDETASYRSPKTWPGLILLGIRADNRAVEPVEGFPATWESQLRSDFRKTVIIDDDVCGRPRPSSRINLTVDGEDVEVRGRIAIC